MAWHFVKCHKREAACSFFTDGKVYEGWKENPHGKVVYIKDDHGTVRAVIPDGTPCAHLLAFDKYNHTDPVRSGYWTLA